MGAETHSAHVKESHPKPWPAKLLNVVIVLSILIVLFLKNPNLPINEPDKDSGSSNPTKKEGSNRNSNQNYVDPKVKVETGIEYEFTLFKDQCVSLPKVEDGLKIDITGNGDTYYYQNEYMDEPEIHGNGKHYDRSGKYITLYGIKNSITITYWYSKKQ